MSYSGGPLRPVGYLSSGLGQGTGEFLSERRFDKEWWLICVPAEPVRNMLDVFDAWSRGDVPPITHSHDMKEEQNPVSGFRLLWIRMGKHPGWWPGASGEYNFGPTTFTEDCPGGHRSYIGSKPANSMRVRKQYWHILGERAAETRRSRSPSLPYPPSMWRPHADGYVRLRVDDPLLKRVRDNLVEFDGDYLSGDAEVSTKDDSKLVQALKRYFDTAQGERIRSGRSLFDVGTWPSGYNFGPNTSGNELRIHPKLLNTVLNRVDPRAAAAQERTRTALRNMRIKPPIVGGLPSVKPGHSGLQAGNSHSAASYSAAAARVQSKRSFMVNLNGLKRMIE